MGGRCPCNRGEVKAWGLRPEQGQVKTHHKDTKTRREEEYLKRRADNIFTTESPRAQRGAQIMKSRSIRSRRLIQINADK
jgi:hypothetical protein